MQRLLENDAIPMDVVMDIERYMVSNKEVPHTSMQAILEVIPETQPLPPHGSRKVYKEILASIGLDSPTQSHDTRDHSLGEEHRLPQVNTPIRNSAASLMALGKHIFTPGQGRSWEGRNKSPLGVNQEVNPHGGSNVEWETM